MGTVNVVVVLVPDEDGDDGDDGDEGDDGESEHPTARMLRPTMSNDIRNMRFFLLDSLRRISGRG
jgi:hypothetical protein